jgi:hypothetical protein
MKEKHNSIDLTDAEKESDPSLNQNALARRAILLSMDWDSLTDNEKLEAMPGLGYN